MPVNGPDDSLFLLATAATNGYGVDCLRSVEVCFLRLSLDELDNLCGGLSGLLLRADGGGGAGSGTNVRGGAAVGAELECKRLLPRRDFDRDLGARKDPVVAAVMGGSVDGPCSSLLGCGEEFPRLDLREPGLPGVVTADLGIDRVDQLPKIES